MVRCWQDIIQKAVEGRVLINASCWQSQLYPLSSDDKTRLTLSSILQLSDLLFHGDLVILPSDSLFLLKADASMVLARLIDRVEKGIFVTLDVAIEMGCRDECAWRV